VSTLPLLANHAPHATVAVRRGRALVVSRFLGAAHAVADRLPAGGSVLLLCEDRVAFAVGFAAALLRGTCALLPPSRAPYAVAEIARSSSSAYALVDARSDAPALPEVVVDPWIDAPAVHTLPQIRADAVAAIVHTSGTKGDSRPHAKRWSSLVRGALALRERIGFCAGASIVGAVPAQHMWGLEATIMLALQGGGVLHPSTPLLPADIAAALDDVAAPRWLVATPLHLRSCMRSGVRLAPLAGVLTAASPLDAELARQVEDAFDAPVVEIYGSTETGVIGTRRTAHRMAFMPLPGVRVEPCDEGIVVQGGHLDEAVLVSDHATVAEDGSVTLTGRDADLVKIGGKRASLARLDRELLSVEGVVDGAFLVVDDTAAGQRLAAVAVAPSTTVSAILAALRERIDPVFMPRPLKRVDALPRNALGKLPDATLRALAAQQADVDLSSYACDAVVPATHAALPGHFPGRPIVPAAWMLTLVASACREAWHAPAASLRLQRARFRSPLPPDIRFRIELRRIDERSIGFACTLGTTRIADGTFVIVAPDA
jgi:acyl-coenzyme A synthetase/AMP-(fatty) acid ligase/3-hydroxymyristoyl/3-hydroxydecanoyl-(acyl carrier protein) dehydratase